MDEKELAEYVITVFKGVYHLLPCRKKHCLGADLRQGKLYIHVKHINTLLRC